MRTARPGREGVDDGVGSQQGSFAWEVNEPHAHENPNTHPSLQSSRSQLKEGLGLVWFLLFLRRSPFPRAPTCGHDGARGRETEDKSALGRAQFSPPITLLSGLTREESGAQGGRVTG